MLGRQGLWPGRRWEGKIGTELAMNALEHVQLDPLNVIARSHDLMLLSRVRDYRPAHYESLVYDDRKYFEWGNWLATRPIAEWPHWRVVMDRTAASMANDHPISPAVFTQVRRVLREKGQCSNRDFEMLKRMDSYRGRKETALALFQMWISGEVVTRTRRRFERVYSFAKGTIPPEHLRKSPTRAAEEFLLLKTVSFNGLHAFVNMQSVLRRPVSVTEMASLQAGLVRRGRLVPVEVAGWKKRHYARAEELPQLEQLAAGRTPIEWQPLGRTTEEEVSFLAPLENASARGRAKTLFGFDYVWEVYKPVEQRRWGYYTLPILWGDCLVGRLNPRMDRVANRLVIDGFWLEEVETGRDSAFARALGRGLETFREFLGVSDMRIEGIGAVTLRSLLRA